MSISRTSSRTPLQDHLLPLYSSSEKPQPPPLMAQLLAVAHPRKSRQRTTLLALLSLILLSTYVFFVHFPEANTSFALRRQDTKPAASQLTLALESIRKSGLATMSKSVDSAKQVSLTNDQELAVISSFLASLPQNQIPSFVDPSRPIDPQLVLDFDTRAPRAPEEVRAMVDDVWSKNPVFLYSKLYSAPSREVKAILDGLNLKPSPTIIDVDMRDVGSIQDIREKNNDGTLRQMIAHSGAVIDGATRKKKKH